MKLVTKSVYIANGVTQRLHTLLMVSILVIMILVVCMMHICDPGPAA